MSNKSNPTVATMGIDIGKNPFHVVGLDRRGAIVLRQKWLGGQIEARLAAMPSCLIGMEACVGADARARCLRLSSETHRENRRGAQQPWPSRPSEFHPEPLTEPYVNLSIHTARAIARRLPPSIDHRVPLVAG
jgi:hypothetical protein